MDFLRETARRAPDSPAVVGLPDERGGGVPIWTYRELDRWADTVASALVRTGVAPGERVATRLPPCPEAVVLLHAVFRAGATLVPVHTEWTEAEFVRGVSAVGTPAIVFTTVGEVVEWDGEGPSGPEVDPVSLPGPHSGAPAAIVLTSGTTGAPNPVRLTHRNLSAAARGAAERLGLTQKDCWLTSLSPGHVGGLALLHRASVVGSSLLTRPRFHAEEAAELLDEGLASHASLVPVMLSRLLEARGDVPAPPSLRCLIVGGDATPISLLERALELGYPIALTYGLTEGTSQVATAPPDLVRRKPGTVGKALPGVEIRIGGPDADGIGEILVKGPTVVHGLPRARGEGGVEEHSVFVDTEGWLHTGDLGRLDADGDLWVVGRSSERIVTAGVTIEPAEVEEVVLRHPGVREVAAFGVPDPEWGQRVVIAVVPADADAPPSLEEIQEFARERLASAKRPREVRIVASLPRDTHGKVARSRLA